MSQKKQHALQTSSAARQPFALLREVTAELDRVFDQPFGAFRWPAFKALAAQAPANWTPDIEVFERDQRLVTRVDLPGIKKEDVKVEVTDGHLAISGERKHESEETKNNVYRCEQSYGRFYRSVPLPEGVTLDEVKATFADGVLEVSVPLPKAQAKPRTVQIEGPTVPAKDAAA